MSKITARKLDMPTGRSAFVGQREGCADYFVQLKNGTTVTRLRLTEEGAINLRKLLYVDDCTGEPAEYEVGDKESTLATWQLVKELST